MTCIVILSKSATIAQLDLKKDNPSNHFVQSVPGQVGTEMEQLRRSAGSQVNDWNDYAGPQVHRSMIGTTTQARRFTGQ